MACPLCGADQITVLTERKSVPVLQNVLCATKEEGRDFPKSDIKLCMCNQCEFVYNETFHSVEYDYSYENNQSYSNLFSEYMVSLKNQVVQYIREVRGRILVLEVGCGQGTFIHMVRDALGELKDCRLVGFDPAYHGDEIVSDIKFIPEYFSATYFDNEIFDYAVILSRHVIEHIQDPHFLLRECSNLPAVHTQLFLETPDFNWILQHVAFEDIVYEHCSFFNPKSINIALSQAGFIEHRLLNVFGGQYMWIEAELNKTSYGTDYQIQENKFIYKWRTFLEERFYEKNRTIVWGGGAKGVAFLNLIDVQGQYVDAVIDINPAKQGKFLVGTGHRIVSPEYLKAQTDNVVIIVMNENYLEEISKQIQEFHLMIDVQILILR